MSDVAGNAALLVEPGSKEELAEAIESVVRGDRGLGERLALGKQIAAGYTWEKSAAIHTSVYEWAASGATPRSTGSSDPRAAGR
jgi:glycosyltransferase involved in cell wall biosynthesis